MAQFQKGQSGNPAGRPRKAEKYAGQIAQTEDRIADRLPDRVAALELLAEGGYEQIEEVFEPAGLIYTGFGEARTRAFPDLPPQQLVCVRRVRTIAAPDRAANIYLIDRILGKPTAEIDAKIDTPEDGQLARFLEAVTKIYGPEPSE